MTMEEWQQKMIAANELWRTGKRQESLDELDGIAHRLESERSRDAADWEREQALSSKAYLLTEDPSRLSEAVAACLEVATLKRGQLRSYGQSIGLALALAALCQFKQGKNVEAFQTGEDALALMGMHGEVSKIFQDLIERMREFRQSHR